MSVWDDPRMLGNRRNQDDRIDRYMQTMNSMNNLGSSNSGGGVGMGNNVQNIDYLHGNVRSMSSSGHPQEDMISTSQLLGKLSSLAFQGGADPKVAGAINLISSVLNKDSAYGSNSTQGFSSDYGSSHAGDSRRMAGVTGDFRSPTSDYRSITSDLRTQAQSDFTSPASSGFRMSDSYDFRSPYGGRSDDMARSSSREDWNSQVSSHNRNSTKPSARESYDNDSMRSGYYGGDNARLHSSTMTDGRLPRSKTRDGGRSQMPDRRRDDRSRKRERTSRWSSNKVDQSGVSDFGRDSMMSHQSPDLMDRNSMMPGMLSGMGNVMSSAAMNPNIMMNNSATPLMASAGLTGVQSTLYQNAMSSNKANWGNMESSHLGNPAWGNSNSSFLPVVESSQFSNYSRHTRSHQRSEKPYGRPTTLWVGNVQKQVTDGYLQNMFSKYGKIIGLRRLRTKFCAFIDYEYRSCADAAIKDMSGVILKGKPLKIQIKEETLLNLIEQKPLNKFPNDALACHMCKIADFKTQESFLRHLKRDRHKITQRAFHERNKVAINILRENVEIMEQRKKNVTDTFAKKCSLCRCIVHVTEGSTPEKALSNHADTDEHRLVYRFLNKSCCRKKFENRRNYEDHKLTLQHLKASYYENKDKEQLNKKNVDDKTAGVTQEVSKNEMEKFLDSFDEMMGTNMDNVTDNTRVSDVPEYDSESIVGLKMMQWVVMANCTVCSSNSKAKSRLSVKDLHCRSADHYYELRNLLWNNHQQKLKRQREEEIQEEEENMKLNEEIKSKVIATGDKKVIKKQKVNNGVTTEKKIGKKPKVVDEHLNSSPTPLKIIKLEKVVKTEKVSEEEPPPKKMTKKTEKKETKSVDVKKEYISDDDDDDDEEEEIPVKAAPKKKKIVKRVIRRVVKTRSKVPSTKKT